MVEPKKVVKSYTTKTIEIKLLGDMMKASKITTTKKRRMKKNTILEDEDIDIVDVGDEGGN